MKLLDVWLALSLVVSGLALFLFSNMLIYGEVCFYEHIKPVLYFEYLVSVFVFAISLYIFWLIWRKGYEIKLLKKE